MIFFLGKQFKIFSPKILTCTKNWGFIPHIKARQKKHQWGFLLVEARALKMADALCSSSPKVWILQRVAEELPLFLDEKTNKLLRNSIKQWEKHQQERVSRETNHSPGYIFRLCLVLINLLRDSNVNWLVSIEFYFVLMDGVCLQIRLDTKIFSIKIIGHA